MHLAKKSYPWMEGTERGLALVLCSLCRALTWSQRLCVRGWSGTGITQHRPGGNGLVLPLWLTDTWKPLAFPSPVPAVEKHGPLYFISQRCTPLALIFQGGGGTQHTFFCTEILFPTACRGTQLQQGAKRSEVSANELSPFRSAGAPFCRLRADFPRQL